MKTFDAIFVTPRGFEHEVAGAIITGLTHGEKFCGHAATTHEEVDSIVWTPIGLQPIEPK